MEAKAVRRPGAWLRWVEGSEAVVHLVPSSAAEVARLVELCGRDGLARGTVASHAVALAGVRAITELVDSWPWSKDLAPGESLTTTWPHPTHWGRFLVLAERLHQFAAWSHRVPWDEFDLVGQQMTVQAFTPGPNRLPSVGSGVLVFPSAHGAVVYAIRDTSNAVSVALHKACSMSPVEVLQSSSARGTRMPSLVRKVTKSLAAWHEAESPVRWQQWRSIERLLVAEHDRAAQNRRDLVPQALDSKLTPKQLRVLRALEQLDAGARGGRFRVKEILMQAKVEMESSDSRTLLRKLDGHALPCGSVIRKEGGPGATRYWIERSAEVGR